MSNISDGGPAFPVIFQHSDATSEQHGMSLRDYFAAKALNGLCPHISEYTGSKWAHDMAAQAYTLADAMLKARQA